MMRRAILIGGLAAATVLPGCVKRTLSISSDPPGALVYLNDREVGRTPVEVDFLYHGRYDVRLQLDEYEPLLTSGKASAPLWDTVPLDFVAEIIPADLNNRIHWHYVLAPAETDRAALIDRAGALRGQLRRETDAPASGG
ncbi:MAG: PEGA domain-containing protein [Phycisphaerales bacterium]|nr:PEGA domain-containing protein [Phycisphaerales bacterium]